MQLERRSILKWATNMLGAVFGAVLGIPAIGYLTDPRNRPVATGAFKPVAHFSELKENVPRAVVIRDVRRDAWTLHPNDEVGRVWLIWRGEQTDDQIGRAEAREKNGQEWIRRAAQAHRDAINQTQLNVASLQIGIAGDPARQRLRPTRREFGSFFHPRRLCFNLRFDHWQLYDPKSRSDILAHSSCANCTLSGKRLWEKEERPYLAAPMALPIRKRAVLSRMTVGGSGHKASR